MVFGSEHLQLMGLSGGGQALCQEEKIIDHNVCILTSQ